jgi:predicted phage gp36 major capsid-like protein
MNRDGRDKPGHDERKAVLKPTSMDIDTHNDLETKSGIPHDAVVTHADMMRALEAFKDANDERLDKRDGDIVLEEKLARINATIDAQTRRLDEITLKSARPADRRGGARAS